MKLKEALPSIFNSPLPLVEGGTPLVVAGSLLDTPRRDAVRIVSAGAGKSASSADNEKCLVFSGYSALVGLLQSKPTDYYRFLFETCEKASLSVRPLTPNTELTEVLRTFAETKFGWAVVKGARKYGVVALSDLIPLYRSGVLETDLSVGEIASPKIFALPPSTSLKDALGEMVKHRIRRVFLSGGKNKFVSDREILIYIFSPERMRLTRGDSRTLLGATLADVGAVKAVEVDGRTTIKEASRLYKSESGAWCLVCDDGLVTPWDLVMKPWKMGRLVVRETAIAMVRRSGGLHPMSAHAFFEGLKKQGYSVTFNRSFKGKSGTKHHVDVLAENPQGRKVVGRRTRRKESAWEILSLYVAAFDGEAEACYIIKGELERESRELAEIYKITPLIGKI
ncbi:MAG: CBS domain-containing protein [Thaumarchaeota archaeon]|nr:CBS domain-containing protein [Nitrososphaerota archaeon]